MRRNSDTAVTRVRIVMYYCFARIYAMLLARELVLMIHYSAWDCTYTADKECVILHCNSIQSESPTQAPVKSWFASTIQISMATDFFPIWNRETAQEFFVGMWLVEVGCTYFETIALRHCSEI
jgi:hypothetical protein